MQFITISWRDSMSIRLVDRSCTLYLLWDSKSDAIDVWHTTTDSPMRFSRLPM